ncbi:hypothetical protein AMAG_20316 [Allomyces macrogynus ATCC 38327]|uniref:Protein kinase domain-containing protein n=1 Tax=Allomyces macrogynus (strain ATCC 38327) TaxID=578462 RepID=A0A0L0T7M0_ALLM3|nr:hypothetical protein AMAG_20316 [Allomyces macrogynus ATCC 38327]|eukprot:KNE70725.1 hypothetical protein AMAG_20316 [Allomyces macrogynus ATCC 38327]
MYGSKEHIIKQRAYRNIIRERQLLEKVFHPFIVNLCFAWQDDLYLYMAFDLMLGGDLRFRWGATTGYPRRRCVLFLPSPTFFFASFTCAECWFPVVYLA